MRFKALLIQKSRPRINASNPAKLKTTDAIRITITARLLIGVRLCVPDNTYVADNIFLRNEIFYPVNCSKRTLRLAMDTYPYTAAVIMNALIVRDRRRFLSAKINRSKTHANVFQ